VIATHLDICKSHIISETFVRSADENYITARWCAQSGQHTDFAWLTVHALEKYIKAFLLANGRSAKAYSHDIEKLYEAMVSVCGQDLINVSLVGGLETQKAISAESFLSEIYTFGNPDARYGIFGSSISWNDLKNLDSMVFAIRRLICPLDHEVDGVRVNVEDVVPTYREWLRTHPSKIFRHGHGGHLGKVIDCIEHPLRTVALNCNLAFAPKDFQHDWSWQQSSWRESAIDRLICEPLVNPHVESDHVAMAIELADWLLENIKVPCVVDIKATVAKAKLNIQQSQTNSN
jgi:HEPN domain